VSLTLTVTKSITKITLSTPSPGILDNAKRYVHYCRSAGLLVGGLVAQFRLRLSSGGCRIRLIL